MTRRVWTGWSSLWFAIRHTKLTDGTTHHYVSVFGFTLEWITDPR